MALELEDAVERPLGWNSGAFGLSELPPEDLFADFSSVSEASPAAAPPPPTPVPSSPVATAYLLLLFFLPLRRFFLLGEGATFPGKMPISFIVSGASGMESGVG